MRPTVVASVAVALIVALLLLGVVPGHGVSVSRANSPARLHMFGTGGIVPTDRYGGAASAFLAGYQGFGSYRPGQIYFTAYDPSDTTAIVAINDKNATRDGLKTPVASWNVSFATNTYYYSWQLPNNQHYTIPLSLLYGGTWNITITGSVAGTTYQNFTVHTYALWLTPAQPALLAGHSGTILYNVNSTATQGPYGHLTSVNATAYYQTGAVTWAALPGFPKALPASGQGQFSFNLPTNAYSPGVITLAVWANVTSLAVKTTEWNVIGLQVGSVDTPAVSLASCPFGCATNQFATGAPVYVVVVASILTNFGNYSAANLTASFYYYSGTTKVTPAGSPPASVNTDARGVAEIVFQATSTVFSTTGVNNVTVTLTDSQNPNVHVNGYATFYVLPVPPLQASLQVLLNAGQYYSGDTVTATWQIGGGNGSTQQGWTTDYWWAWLSSTSTLVASGNLSSTASSGTFNFLIPAGVTGNIRVSAAAHNATQSLIASAYAMVTKPTILLNPSELLYLPGDQLTVSVTTEGQAFTGTSMWETVTDSNGNSILQGALTGAQISFPIPKVGAPRSVQVSVSAESATAGVVGQASITLSQASGYTLDAGVSTVSNYVDGSYQPGQTIKVSYSISTIGNSVLPKSFQITVYPRSIFSNGFGQVFVWSTSPKGSVSFTIPSSTPAGSQDFAVQAYFGSGGGCGICYAITQFSVNVQPNPSALNYELGAGSGVTVGWVILLVLLLVVLIVALLAWRRKGSSGMMMKAEAPPASDPAWKAKDTSAPATDPSSSSPPSP